MSHTKFKCIASLVVAWMIAVPAALQAQDVNVAATLYGQGVEAFFAGRSTDAEAFLSRSIEISPDDPRVYYFRSMSRLREGREDEAMTDMQVGADVEAQHPNRFAIGKALERVQGPSRLVLEQYRNRARLSHAVKPQVPVTAPDAAVLRERRVVPLDEFSQPGAPRAFAAPETATPPSKSPAAPSTKSAGSPNAAPAATGPDPFADETAPQTPPKAPATKSAPPTAPPPVPPAPKVAPKVEKAPAGDDNPFL